MQSDYMDRVLTLEGSSNIRDLGGYPTMDGKTTRWKTILRSGGMDQLTASAQQALLDHGIKHIVDLREGWEAEKYPNVFMTSPLMSYINCSLIGSDAVNQAIEGVTSLSAMYILLLEQCQPQVKTILESIAGQLENGGVVVHCYAGKDRTGIITALLLAIARLSPEIIAADYALSQELLKERIQAWRTDALSKGRDMQRFEEDVSSRPETMLTTLTYLDTQFGGVENYLRSIGLADETISHLHSHLVE